MLYDDELNICDVFASRKLFQSSYYVACNVRDVSDGVIQMKSWCLVSISERYSSHYIERTSCNLFAAWCNWHSVNSLPLLSAEIGYSVDARALEYS